MKRPPEHVLENESRLALKNLLPSEWVVRDKSPDYAIDLEVVIVEGEEVTNKVLWLQIKATESIKHPHKMISYQIGTKHLEYYEGCHLPVLILYWIKSENVFYYLFAQRFIEEKLSVENPNWREQKTVTIPFSSDSKLESIETLESIATEGYLYIVQRDLSQHLSQREIEIKTWLDGIPKSHDKELKERTLKAISHMRDEEYPNAISELEDLLRICTPSFTERIAILLNLGISYYSLSKNNEALKNYNAILKLTEKIDEKDALEGRYCALGNIGLIYLEKGELDTALKYMKKAINIQRKSGYKLGKVNQLGNIGSIYRAKGEMSKALKYHHDAIKIYREIGYKLGEAAVLGNIGLIYRAKGEMDKALKCHKDSLKIQKEIGFKQGEATQLGSMGPIYLEKGELDTALKYMKEALQTQREIGYKKGEATQLGNIGSIYRAKGEYDEALQYMKDSLKIQREIGFKQGEATVLGNIGLIYYNKGDLDKALEYIKDAIKILDKFNLVYGRDILQNAIDLIKRKKGLFFES